MNIKNAHEVRDKLREQQRKLLEAIRTHLSLSGSDSLYTLPNAHDATDDDAIADVIAESDVVTLGVELAELREILRAKRRIAEGSYGKCIDCGGAISSARLEAYPTAERCIACQSAYETASGAAKPASL